MIDIDEIFRLGKWWKIKEILAKVYIIKSLIFKLRTVSVITSKVIVFQADRHINMYSVVVRVNIEVLHVSLDSNDLNMLIIIIALFY